MDVFCFFSTGPPPRLLPVLAPLGSGTEATHQPSPALRLFGFWWSRVERQVVRMIAFPGGIQSTVRRRCRIYWRKNWRLYEPSHHGWTSNGCYSDPNWLQIGIKNFLLVVLFARELFKWSRFSVLIFSLPIFLSSFNFQLHFSDLHSAV